MNANPELVGAAQLAAWAGTPTARTELPRLLRKLLAATPGVSEVSAPAGASVGRRGRDAYVDGGRGTPFVPRGKSVWEMGTSSDPGRKAQRDYRNRTRSPGGLDISRNTFVFVTPRPWDGKDAWRARKLQEKKWRGVRVLDVDDVEAWLEEVPAVHIWLSELLGLRPRDARTLETWWREWSDGLRVPLPPGVLLAGREEAAEALRRRLAAEPAVIAVRANSRDEAVAFTAVTLGRLTADGHEPAPSLVVSSEEAWHRCASSPSSGVLIAQVAGTGLAAATRAGHHVIVPLGASDPSGRADITLPQIDRQAARRALEAAGVPYERADRWATRARRSLVTLRRELALDPRVITPSWAERPAADVVAPLVLAGSWKTTREDQDAIAVLVARPWADIERELVALAASEDPPLRRSGGEWRLTAPEDAWDQLNQMLTSQDLERWREQTVTILTEDDPSLDLSPEERPYASLRGATRTWSATLRAGLATGAALLGANGETVLPDGSRAADQAAVVVRDLLARPNRDRSGRVWQTLCYELPLLAEAAPDLFLDAVEEGLRGDSPLLGVMFRDRQASFLSPFSPHTYLLWALEVLAWSPDYLLRAAAALARLVEVDPNGQLANRPSGSLRSIFLLWIPRTAASPAERLHVLEVLAERYPDVTWKLLLSVLPQLHDSSSSNPAPRFRQWRPDQEHPSAEQRIEALSHTVGLVLQMAAQDPLRWAELLSRPATPSAMPSEHQERVLAALEAANFAEADREGLLELWKALTDVAAKHREFRHADWAMAEAQIERIEAVAERVEPTGAVERFGRLFDWRPHLPDADRRDFEGFRQAIADAQDEAVREVLETDGAEGLMRVAEASPLPAHVGAAAARVRGEELAEALVPLLGAEGARGELAHGWTARLAHEDPTWPARAAADIAAWEERRQVAFLLALPAVEATWALADQASEGASTAYWSQVGTHMAPHEAAEAMTMRLLEHGRSWSAMSLLSDYCHRDDSELWQPEPELVRQTLEDAVKAEPESAARLESPGYEIGVLLDYLVEADVDDSVLARFEWAYFSVLQQHRRPRALFNTLAHDPTFFVQLVSVIYPPPGAGTAEPDERTTAMADNAWSVLNRWRRPPRTTDGNLDGDILKAWVEEARALFAAQEQADIGDDQIGHLLAGSPPGEDGAWPAEPVRDLVESLESEAFEVGLKVGRANMRGVTSRGVYEGGNQERALAEDYRESAEAVGARWPATGRLLRTMAEDYEAEARMHDTEAEGRADSE